MEAKMCVLGLIMSFSHIWDLRRYGFPCKKWSHIVRLLFIKGITSPCQFFKSFFCEFCLNIKIFLYWCYNPHLSTNGRLTDALSAVCRMFLPHFAFCQNFKFKYLNLLFLLLFFSFLRRVFFLYFVF